jgi:hypothetical protein
MVWLTGTNCIPPYNRDRVLRQRTASEIPSLVAYRLGATSRAPRSSIAAMSPVLTHRHGQKDLVTLDHAITRDEESAAMYDGDMLQLGGVDPVKEAKMQLVNNAIDEIGFTPYHAKLFVLNGFG